MSKKALFTLFIGLTLLTACGQNKSVAKTTTTNLTGTIIENPSHLSGQTSFLLVNEESNSLIAYLNSKDISLSNFIEQTGTITGNIQSTSNDEIPVVLATVFTPIANLSLEEILKNTVRREGNKEPFNKNWSKETDMLVLQSDTTNGSAQVRVIDSDQTLIIKLVKNQENWHIADMERQAYSSPEPTIATGSGEVL